MTESRLHRWSKQKTEAIEAEETPVEQPDETEIDPVSQIDAEKQNEQDEDKPPVELPDIETLGDDDDYSMFMSSEVDASLKKLALRKLFKAPFFNIRDGLNDYDEDFTTFQELGDIVTSDMKFHAERKKAEAEKKKREAEAQAAEAEEAQEFETMASEVGEPDREKEESEVAHDTESSEQTDPQESDDSSTT